LDLLVYTEVSNGKLMFLTSSFWGMDSTHDLSTLYCMLYQMVDWFWFFTDLTVLSFTLSRLGPTFSQFVISCCVCNQGLCGWSAILGLLEW